MEMRLKLKGSCEMNGRKYILDTNAIVALLKGSSEILKIANLQNGLPFQ